MIAKKIVYALVFLFMMQAVIAVSTTINIKTGPNQEVQINILKPGDEGLWITLFANSTESGDASVTFGEDYGAISLSLISRKDGKIFKTKKLTGYHTSTTIDINLLDEPAPIVNNSVSETPAANTSATETPAVNETETTAEDIVETAPEEPVQEETQEEAKVTGNIISNLSESFLNKNYLYIILAGIFGAGVIVFLIFKLGGSSGGPKQPEKINVIKWSEMNPGVPVDFQKALEEKERKLAEAQKEISILKNQDKIKELERKMEEERKEIEKLKNGLNFS